MPDMCFPGPTRLQFGLKQPIIAPCETIAAFYMIFYSRGRNGTISAWYYYPIKQFLDLIYINYPRLNL